MRVMLIALAVLASICQAANARDGADGFDSPPQTTATNFALSSLRPGCSMAADFEGEPLLTVRVTCNGEKPKTVRTLPDLVGYVSITDETQALEFVRLFTEGGRWMLTGIGDYAEVRWASEEKVSHFFVTKDLFEKCCRAPKVARSAGGETGASFDVTRVVVDREYRVYLLTQRVTGVGIVEVLGQRRLPPDGRTLGVWSFHDR
jgi:hypothetical protein